MSGFENAHVWTRLFVRPNDRGDHGIGMTNQTLVVTCVTKDRVGNIIGIGGMGWKHSAHDAIHNIRREAYQYRVLSPSGPYVRPYGTQYLRSDRDPHTGNNLDCLPSC